MPFPPASRKNAFTLVELVIAIAVTAFCLVTIISLLPAGIHSAQESRRQTRAAYLAEQIFSDLRSSSFTQATILYQKDGMLAALPSFSLVSASTIYLTCDDQNNVLASATATQYSSGVSGGSYLVEIAVTPSNISNLSSVSVEVSTPARAMLSARTRYGFQSLIGNRQ